MFGCLFCLVLRSSGDSFIFWPFLGLLRIIILFFWKVFIFVAGILSRSTTRGFAELLLQFNSMPNYTRVF